MALSIDLCLPVPLKTSYDISKCYDSHTFKIQVNYYVLRSKT